MKTILVWIFAIPWTVFWGSLSLITSLFDTTGGSGFKCMQKWARGLLAVSGVKVDVKGFEKIDKGRNYLFISNHQSQVDIIALSASIPVKFGWMAKESLFRIPFLGWHMKRMGYIPVDRSSVRSSTQGLVNASKALKEGASLLIFPEGSRSMDGSLKPFKDGAFYLAIEAGTPVIPLSINGTRNIIEKGSSKISGGKVKIIASEAITIDKFTQDTRKKLKELVRDRIASNITL